MPFISDWCFTWVWKHPFYQRCSQEVGTSWSDILGSDWLWLRWWVKTLVALLLPHQCSFPPTAPGCRCTSQRSAWSCATGCWTRFRGECCCNELRRQCRCHWTLLCWGGPGRGQPGLQGNRHLLGLLQLLRRTSGRRCGCWRRYWTECCCWSGWSTEPHPAEERVRVRQRDNKAEKGTKKREGLTFECLFGESFPGTSCLCTLLCPPPAPGPWDDGAGTCQRGSRHKTHTDIHRIKPNYIEPSCLAKRIKYL